MNNLTPRLIRLAKMNNLSESLKKQEIVKSIREEYSINDEFDILHEAVLYLFNLISELHEGEIDNKKFVEYHDRIKSIKEYVNETMNKLE